MRNTTIVLFCVVSISSSVQFAMQLQQHNDALTAMKIIDRQMAAVVSNNGCIHLRIGLSQCPSIYYDGCVPLANLRRYH